MSCTQLKSNNGPLARLISDTFCRYFLGTRRLKAHRSTILKAQRILGLNGLIHLKIEIVWKV
jgi:hypothetical protein